MFLSICQEMGHHLSVVSENIGPEAISHTVTRVNVSGRVSCMLARPKQRLSVMKWLALSIVLFYSSIGFAAVPQAELDSLLALYNSTDGENWTDDTNWLIGDPCDNSWFGISCDGSSNIERVSLASNDLVGTIPPELGNLNIWGQSKNFGHWQGFPGTYE